MLGTGIIKTIKKYNQGLIFVPNQSLNNTSLHYMTPCSHIIAVWKIMCSLYAIYNHYKELETDDNEFYLSRECSTYES